MQSTELSANPNAEQSLLETTIALLITKGKQDGFLSKTEILKELESENVPVDQYSSLFELIGSCGIPIISESLASDNSESLSNQSDDVFLDDSVAAYLRDARQFPLLTAEEEAALGRRICAGDKEAREQLINSNLRLVISIARRYSYYSIPLLDLIQEGNEGLIIAVDRFDWSKGNRISTYATWWIRHQIVKTLSSNGYTIQLPHHMLDAIRSITRIKDRLPLYLGRFPTVEEIAEQASLTPEKVIDIILSNRPLISLNTPATDGNSDDLQGILPSDTFALPAEFLAKEEQRKIIDKLLLTLSQRESLVLRIRYGFYDGRPHSLKEVGSLMDISIERVRQIEARALQKLQSPNCTLILRDFLYR